MEGGGGVGGRQRMRIVLEKVDLVCRKHCLTARKFSYNR